MTMIKYGDDTPIVSIYENDGVEKICQHCGKGMTVVAFMGEEAIEIECEHCCGKGTEQFIELGE